MEIPDLTKLYFPNFSEIPQAQLLSARQRLEAIQHANFPDIDYRPNSPLGDMGLTPFSYLWAGAEIAIGRFMSDLDLLNVSKNVIWNCDYVRRFLGDFAVTDSATLQSSGVARFTFVEDKEYILDRRARYQFNGNIFNLRMANDGPFIIRPVGSDPMVGVNVRNLVDIGGGVFCVDLPLIGTMTAAVEAGATGTTDYPITELASVIALEAFNFGLPPSSLPVLAEKTRTTFYSATPSSRGGAARFLTREFPDLTGASAVTSGDPEILRDTINPLGIRAGTLDLYASSPRTVVDTQVVRLVYDEVAHVFVGKLAPSGIPYMLDSVVASAAPDITFIQGDTVKIFSRSKDYGRAPMASCAYSNVEELWITVAMPFASPSGDELIPTENEGDNRVGVFALQWRQDPLLPAVIDATEAQGAMPFGVDILTRGFVPIVIDRFIVQYARRPGTTVGVEAARQEILAYINNLAAPQIYTDTRVSDAMFAAGASDVVGFVIEARVQWSVAHLFLPFDAPTPEDSYSGALSASKAAQVITIRDTRGLKVAFSDPDLGTADATYEAVGPRNSILILDEANLLFSETR
jgi:hypothetical protein